VRAVATRSRTRVAARPSGRRTGRRLRVLLVLLTCGLLAYLLAPLFQKAIQQLTLPLDYPSIIREQAAAKGLDPALIAAVIYAETRFDARTSPTGAEGLMQIEPATAEFLAHRSGGTAFRVSDLASPAVNIAYGSYYLRYLMDEFSGPGQSADTTKILALAAYNGGETNVQRWLADARARGQAFALDDIPFPQTRAYVEKVLQAQEQYRHNYARELGYRE
jgi:soluble lytic murein transglycosylase